MSLRVLLADESSTIKKVMQLALQEYDVEVKAVPVGLDVQAVAYEFKPDIVFADVFLPKKTGYDVCSSLKNDPSTRDVPVVLMWSGFMEIDVQKADECRADGRIEKPFDADTLRKFVKDLVPKTQTNSLTEYLNFPNLPEIAEDQMTAPRENEPVDLDFGTPQGESFELIGALGSEDDVAEDFSTVPLPVYHENPEDEWAQGDLGKFKLNVPTEDEEPMTGSLSAKFISQIVEDEPINVDSFEETNNGLIDLTSSDDEEFNLDKTVIAPMNKKAPPQTAAPVKPQGKPVVDDLDRTRVGSLSSEVSHKGGAAGAIAHFSEKDLEKMVREEIRDVLESVAWKILPDLAERIIREEISKLLRDTEKTY